MKNTKLKQLLALGKITVLALLLNSCQKDETFTEHKGLYVNGYNIKAKKPGNIEDMTMKEVNLSLPYQEMCNAQIYEETNFISFVNMLNFDTNSKDTVLLKKLFPEYRGDMLANEFRDYVLGKGHEDRCFEFSYLSNSGDHANRPLSASEIFAIKKVNTY